MLNTFPNLELIWLTKYKGGIQMANLFGDSNDSRVPALRVLHTREFGFLMDGFFRQDRVFLVTHEGGIWANGGITAKRNITTESDVYARGVRLTSDKNAKENFSSVNTLDILDKLASMQIQSWNYKDDSSGERHIGPTAQDFQAAFGLNGHDETHISSIDLQGVALAAIQGLNEKNEKLKDENAKLKANLANLESRLSALES